MILSGSTASVYDSEKHAHAPWLDREFDLIRRCAAERVPLLGVCFGHQAVNVALGGEVRNATRRTTFVEMEPTRFDETLDGVSRVVPVLHAHLVTRLGNGMVGTARTGYNDDFCRRHREAPVWTGQFHPEFTERVPERPSDWDPDDHGFDEVNATRVLANFRRQVDALA